MGALRAFASFASVAVILALPPAAYGQSSPASGATASQQQTAPASSDASDSDEAKPSHPYHRPTEKQKLHSYLIAAFGPVALLDAASMGGVSQARNTPREWGQGADAFGVRMASHFGVSVLSDTASYGLAEVFRVDTAYNRCECTGPRRRFEHAFVSTLTARRGDDGHTVFSFPSLAAPYAGAMVGVAVWYPSRFSPKDGFRSGNYALLGNVARNLAREFLYGGPHTLAGRLPFPWLSGKQKDKNATSTAPGP